MLLLLLLMLLNACSKGSYIIGIQYNTRSWNSRPNCHGGGRGSWIETGHDLIDFSDGISSATGHQRGELLRRRLVETRVLRVMHGWRRRVSGRDEISSGRIDNGYVSGGGGGEERKRMLTCAARDFRRSAAASSVWRRLIGQRKRGKRGGRRHGDGVRSGGRTSDHVGVVFHHYHRGGGTRGTGGSGG